MSFGRAELIPTVANGLRHMLRLIESLILLYVYSIRKLRHPQIMQCSSWTHLNYYTNLKHSTLWASSGLVGVSQKPAILLLFPSVALPPNFQCQGKSLEPTLQCRCTSSKFGKPSRLFWYHDAICTQEQRQSSIPHRKCTFIYFLGNASKQTNS